MQHTPPLIALETILGILALWLMDYSDALSCVRCNSENEKRHGECQNDPPPPITCHSSSSVPQYCMVARELNENDNLLKFVRDCSTAYNNSCILTGLNSPHPYKVCYATCKESGCNPAESLSHSLGVYTMIILTCLAISLSNFLSGPRIYLSQNCRS